MFFEQTYYGLRLSIYINSSVNYEMKNCLEFDQRRAKLPLPLHIIIYNIISVKLNQVEIKAKRNHIFFLDLLEM